MKKSNNQVKSLDYSLNLIERVVLYNLSLYEKFDDKTIYLQKYYNHLINEVFSQKKYIVETYKSKFSNKILIESKSDVSEIIHNIHTFVKKAIEFDMLSEQYAQKPATTQPTTGIQPQKKRTLPNDPKYNGPQMGPASSATQGVKTNNIAATKLQELGVDGYFENLREALYSMPGMISQSVLTFIGPGKVAVGSIWGALAIYDGYKYFKKGLKKYLPKLISDITAIITHLAIPSIADFKKIRDYLKTISMAESLTLQGIAKFIGKILGKKLFLKFLGGLSVGLQFFFGTLEKGILWIEQELNLNLGSDTISKCKEVAQDFSIACQEVGKKDINTIEYPKKSNKKPLEIDRSMDPGKI